MIKLFTKRYRHIDICKGIMIYLVVVGHSISGTSDLHVCIYWFHMSAFLILSGLFVHNKGTLKADIKNRFMRLIVPYMFFSILLGSIARDGSICKQMIGTLMGANGNITYFTFPYYFLTILFVASSILLCIQSLQLKGKNVALLIITLYAITHLMANTISDSILGWIPWNIDIAIFAIVYLYIGNKLSDVIVNIWGGHVFVVLSFVLVILYNAGIFHYQFDLKHHSWHWGLDIVIPIIFLMALLQLSYWINKIGYINTVFSYYGKASMCIMLLHPLFMYINKMLLHQYDINVWIASLINVIQCCLVFIVLSKYKFSRIVLGERL